MSAFVFKTGRRKKAFDKKWAGKLEESDSGSFYWQKKLLLFSLRVSRIYNPQISSTNKRRTNTLAKNLGHSFFSQTCQEAIAVLIGFLSLFLEGLKPNLHLFEDMNF